MDLRQAIWDARVLAHASHRYFAEVGDRYKRLAQWLEGLQLLLSSGAAAAIIAKWPQVSLVVGLAAAFASIGQTVLTPGVKAIGAAGAGRYWQLRSKQWDLVWLELNEGDGQIDLERYKREHALDVEFEEPDLPYNRKISARVQEEAIRLLSPHGSV